VVRIRRAQAHPECVLPSAQEPVRASELLLRLPDVPWAVPHAHDSAMCHVE